METLVSFSVNEPTVPVVDVATDVSTDASDSTTPPTPCSADEARSLREAAVTGSSFAFSFDPLGELEMGSAGKSIVKSKVRSSMTTGFFLVADGGSCTADVVVLLLAATTDSSFSL